jgi:hypothetical protein
MDFPRLSAGGLRFSGLLVPAEEFGLPSEDRRAYWIGFQTSTGLPCFAPVRHNRRGCLLYPGVLVSEHERLHILTVFVRHGALTRSSPSELTTGFRRPLLTGPRRRFTRVHPSDLSLARLAWMVQTRLRHYPSAFARSVTRTLAWVGNRPGHWPGSQHRVTITQSGAIFASRGRHWSIPAAWQQHQQWCERRRGPIGLAAFPCSTRCLSERGLLHLTALLFAADAI